MKTDAKLNNLQIKNALVANTVKVKHIALEDTTIEANIHIAPKIIKELYESNKDTNNFSDDDVKTIAQLLNVVTFTNEGIIFKTPTCFPLIDSSDAIPNESFALCNYENKIVMKVHSNDTIIEKYPEEVYPYIRVQCKVTDDQVVVSLKITFM